MVSRDQRIGGVWPLIVVAAFLVAIAIILKSLLPPFRAPAVKRNQAAAGRIPSDFERFLDEYAAGLEASAVAIVGELYEAGEHGLAVDWLSDEIYEADIAVAGEG